MATPPVRTEISDTYPNPTNAVARAGFGKLYDYVTGLLGATGNAPEARAAIGAVNIAGDTLTGLLKFKTGTAIASAATINLSTATGNTVHITGTTAISAVTMSNGQVMDVIFDGILTLTHNSTTNKLPSGTDIITASGDAARYFSDGTVVYCLNYSRADGTAVASSDAAIYVPVRQTILSGPVDTSGYAAFGGSTGSTTVTASGTLIPAAANGFNINGAINRIGSIVNPSWTGLSTNGTMYLYVDIAADGSCTTGSTTLAPTYRWGGADVTTNGQFTFNIQEMVGKVGNGSTAAQTYRVFVGEVTVAGGVVTAIVWYALMGRAIVTQSTLALSSSYVLNTNIGTDYFCNFIAYFVCKTVDVGYAVGDRLPANMSDATAGFSYGSTASIVGRNAIALATGGAAINDPIPKTGGTASPLTAANWSFEGIVTRGF